MNFFPATMTDVGLKLPFGEVMLTQEVHDVLAQHNTPNNVIVGIRPEHLEDASLIDTYARIRALTFEVKVDFVESLGADKYVHFTTEGAGAHAAQLAELAAESGVGENEFVARVSTESKVTPGQTVELAFDTSKLVIFDADTGANLTIPPGGGSREEQPSAVGRRADHTSRGVTDVLGEVRAHLRAHFARAGISGEPDAASVTFLGTEAIDVLRFGPDDDGVVHYVSLGCSRHPMTDPAEVAADPLRGPRAEVMVALRGSVTGGACPQCCRAGRRTRRRGSGPGARCTGRPRLAAVGGRAVHRFPVGPQRDWRGGAARAPRSGCGAVGNPDHRHRGGVGAAQGCRRDARGVANRRCGRARPSTMSACAKSRRRSRASLKSEPVAAAERAIQQRSRRQNISVSTAG